METPAGEITVVEPLGRWGDITTGMEVKLQFHDAGIYLLPLEA